MVSKTFLSRTLLEDVTTSAFGLNACQEQTTVWECA